MNNVNFLQIKPSCCLDCENIGTFILHKGFQIVQHMSLGDGKQIETYYSKITCNIIYEGFSDNVA